MLTAERLRDVLDYDPDTGVFYRALPQRRVRVGDVAGYVQKGYRKIRVDGVRYYAHRLAWLYVHGEWPSGEIDHINGDRDDNRIANLREATLAQNQQNRKAPRGTRAGLGGAAYAKGRWKASVTLDGVRHHLGTFQTPEEAHSAYLAAKRRLHPFFVGVTDA